MPDTTAGELCETSVSPPLALRIEVLKTYPTADRRSVAEDLVYAFEVHSGYQRYAIVYDHRIRDRTRGRSKSGTESGARRVPRCAGRSTEIHGSIPGKGLAHDRQCACAGTQTASIETVRVGANAPAAML